MQRSVREIPERFKNIYFKRMLKYFLIMVAVWIITYFILKLTGEGNALLRFLARAMNVHGHHTATHNFLSIFGNNVKTSILISLLGIIPIPIYLFFVIFNAVTVGVVLTTGNPLMVFVAAILPHGIFEIPSQLLTTAISARLMWYVFDRIFRRDRVKNVIFKNLLTDTIVDSVLIVIPILLVAGLIEGYITPIIIKAVLG